MVAREAGTVQGRGGKLALCVAGIAVLAGCSSTPRSPAPPSPSASAAALPQVRPGQPSAYSCSYAPLAASRGGFYKDDGPLELPAGLDLVPEPLPVAEPLHRWANNPYSVLGLNFTPVRTVGELRQEGVASWYGRKFHGQKTSSGEVYDMFQMTAAHPTLPIPSYARVTSRKNGRSVVVRINDRGPFLKGRVIDLSFLAACRLGYAREGSTEVEVVSLSPGENAVPASLASRADPAVEVQALPALPPVPAMPLATEPVAASPGGFFLQFGAFGQRSNAENFHAHLVRELDEQQVARLVVQQSGAIWRVRLGPFPDRNLALAEAERLTGRRNLAAVVVRQEAGFPPSP